MCDCGFYSRNNNDKQGKPFQSCPLGQCYMSAHKSQSHGYSLRARGRSTGNSQGSSRIIRETTPQSPAMKVDAEFVRLLDHIMSAAARAQFPSQIIDMSNMRNALPDGGKSPGPFRFLAPTNSVRDCKVGAAGELFVGSPHHDSTNYADIVQRSFVS